MQDSVLIAVNAIAGATSSREAVERLQSLLSRRGLHVEVQTDLAVVSQTANAWWADGRLRAVVGIGGDGTAAALLNATAPGVPITLLARGTENLLARHYRLGASPDAVAEVVADGETCTIDAGVANGRLFVLMASCGFDADVVTRLHAQRRGHIRHWNYVRPILESIRRYDYPPLTIRQTLADGSEQTIEARWLFAFNLPCYAFALGLAPEADDSDGLLDACAFQQGSFWHGLRYLTAVTQQRHQQLADCRTCRVRRLRVESARPVPFQVDGDPGGILPLEIEVLPGRMTLLTPAAGVQASACSPG
jgi:diacylglycerol kinase family enzyme